MGVIVARSRRGRPAVRARALAGTLLAIAALVWLCAPGVLNSKAWALTADEENTVEVYEALLPSVVTILAEVVTESGSPMETQASVSLGSGFAIEPGLVVTNYHVIDNARRIFVVLHDGRREIAGIVGTAPQWIRPEFCGKRKMA